MAKRPRDLADETLDILARLRARGSSTGGRGAVDNRHEDDVLTVVSSPHTPEEAYLADDLQVPGGKGGPKGETAVRTAVRRSPTTSMVAGARSEEAHKGGRGAEDHRLEDDAQTVFSSPHTPDEAFLAVGLQVPGGKGGRKGETAGETAVQRSPTTSVVAGARSEEAQNP